MAVTVSVPAFWLVKLLAPTSRLTWSEPNVPVTVWLASVTVVPPL